VSADRATAPARFSSRALLACVVLGAVITILARVVGVALQATVPWLSFPAPVPWFLGILIAPLLIRRPGAALLTSAVTAVASFGGLALCAGVVVEAVFLVTLRVRTRGGRGLPPTQSRTWLAWALLTAALVSAMSFGFMFLYREFQLLDDDVKLLALVVRVGLGLVYGWLAWLAARGLLRAGVDPQRIGAG
jgi:ABC-type thiamin/hydroxymethylpyrimidine transport system permease subunit